MTVPRDVEDALSAIERGSIANDAESSRLDFKAARKPSREVMKDLAEAVTCLANADGGSVVVGVSDKVSGVEAFHDALLDADETKLRIFELSDPHLVVECVIERWASRDLLVITTPSSPTVHAVGGRSTERVGTSCMSMSPTRIADVVGYRQGFDWSELSTNIPMSKADSVAVDYCRTLLAALPDKRRAMSAKGNADLLRALGLVSPQGVLNNAGALLLTGDLPAQSAIAYAFRRTPSGELVLNEIGTGPVLLTLKTIFDLVEVRVDRKSVMLPNGQQLQVADLPEAAVREAIINAVMHRDYRTAGDVAIEHAPTKISVTSPGPFPPGVGVHNVLTTPSKARNKCLASAMRLLGLAETAGTGVDRMYSEMARIGHAPPSFAAGDEFVQVALLGGAPNSHLTRFTATLPSDEANDADTMLVLLTLLSRRTVDSSVLAPMLQKSLAETETVLRRLSAEPINLVEPTRRTVRRAHPDYHLRSEVVATLGPALSYQRRATDDFDRKVIGLVREAGSVNSRLVKLVLEVDSRTSTRIIQDLVSREMLVRTSESSRGPGVTYGKGPKFPKR